ncbi:MULTISPECIES: RHE_PE00001 family protein [unclassified Beijerinckia]|uniref:RHE_PE00001 family protein n=1 Tax=unclassified Beijerinckia TaxID=2638183 RepID=UPI00089A631C|nr:MULTISPECIES: RHE_PE00001 family protein [unclassified Beijerinckia]MDH7798894.1 hypothetical protein [Beijerinckia sp. GAS462]SED87698.1 HTH DNA binding domain-containing protein [Beijerinckia sp. 28-YEA-48]
MSSRTVTDLKWEDILPSLALAEDRLARLDETLKTSPIRDGFLARTHYLDAIASLALEGELVHLEDLVLADVDMAVRAPSHELVRAREYLSARRQIADTDAGWTLTARAHRLQNLAGRGGQGAAEETDDADRPSVRDTSSSVDAMASADDDLTLAFATLDSALANAQAALADTAAPRQKTPLIYNAECDEEDRFDLWRDSIDQTTHLPSTLAAALALVDWDTQQPLTHRPWLGRLIAAALLRQRGKVTTHLPCLSVGLRAIPPRLRQLSPTAGTTQRLLTQLEAIAAAAEAGLVDHARWLSARAGLLRKIAGRRSSSRLPDLVELVMKRGVISGGMVAEELGVSTRAALDLIEALGLRETTGRGRYRAWGII